MYNSDPAVQLASDRPTREQKLEVCVERTLHSEGVPPFCKHANDILVRTLGLESSGIELARIILKDLGLTSQILRLANSAMYNRSGRPILSVAHAMVLLGWDRVRNLVSTARFIEYFADRSPGLRELMLLSVLSAVHSRDLAVAIGYPRPEEAYICGLFRNLGEVLIGCHYPLEYSLILLRTQNDKFRIERRACAFSISHGTTSDCGRPLVGTCRKRSAGWRGRNGASRRIPNSIGPLFPSLITHATSHMRSTVRVGDGGRSSGTCIRIQMASKTSSQFGISPGSSRLRRDLETQETFMALGVPTGQLRLELQAERAQSILESARVFQAADPPARISGRGLLLSQNRAAAIPNRLLRRGASLDAVKAAGFERVVFGLVNEDHSMVRGRLASGDGVEDLL